MPGKDLLMATMASIYGETTEDGQCLTNLRISGQASTAQPSEPSIPSPPAEFSVKSAVDAHEGPDIYRMLAPVRGICLIINNITYTNEERNRRGSELEGQQLEKLFNQLGFIVRPCLNRTADQIEDDFAKAAQDEDNPSYDAFIGVILSHGRFKDTIAGIDESTIALDVILDKFNNKNCPSLRGKPKMFFIQACRGDLADNGVLACSENVTDAISFMAPHDDASRLPTWTDTVVCYSTVDGFASIRNIITGSWFGDALIKVFSERACDSELNHLLILVSTLESSEGRTRTQHFVSLPSFQGEQSRLREEK